MFRAEAVGWAARGEHCNAAIAAVGNLQLANAARRGGLVIDSLVGNAIQGLGLESLRGLLDNLNEETRLALVDDILRIDSERELVDDIIRRDRQWVSRVEGDDDPIAPELPSDLIDSEECELSVEEQEVLRNLIQEAITMPAAESHKLLISLEHEALASLRMFVIELAPQSFYETSRTLPTKLSSLSPQPLRRIPIDPYTNEPFTYQRWGGRGYHLLKFRGL